MLLYVFITWEKGKKNKLKQSKIKVKIIIKMKRQFMLKLANLVVLHVTVNLSWISLFWFYFFPFSTPFYNFKYYISHYSKSNESLILPSLSSKSSWVLFLFKIFLIIELVNDRFHLNLINLETQPFSFDKVLWLALIKILITLSSV